MLNNITVLGYQKVTSNKLYFVKMSVASSFQEQNFVEVLGQKLIRKYHLRSADRTMSFENTLS